MSRSEYSDDLDQWDLIRWRGAVAAAIRGKRGQALLKELETALEALPEKKLCAGAFASHDGQVCALGAVALKRKMDGGYPRARALEQLRLEWFEDIEEFGEVAAKKFDIAEALAREIMYINDECQPRSDENRHERVLRWVREQIKKQ